MRGLLDSVCESIERANRHLSPLKISCKSIEKETAYSHTILSHHTTRHTVPKRAQFDQPASPPQRAQRDRHHRHAVHRRGSVRVMNSSQRTPSPHCVAHTNELALLTSSHLFSPLLMYTPLVCMAYLNPSHPHPHPHLDPHPHPQFAH